MNNLKQWGLGMHIYHDGFSMLPADGYPSPRRTFIVTMWPCIEQSALYAAYNFDIGFYLPPNCVSNAATGLVARPLPIYYCPSDRPNALWKGNSYWLCRGNYVLNFGTQPLKSPKMGAAGGTFGWVSCSNWTFVPRQVGFGDITDGLSQTLMMSECRFPLADTDFDDRGSFMNDQGQHEFMTVYTPNSGVDSSSNASNPATRDPTIPITNSGTELYSARSKHPDGVQTVFCDGSVHFISNSVSLAIWQALSTYAGNETIDGASY